MVRFGILSTGNIARQFAEGVAGAERCTIAAVGSRRRADADAFAERYGIERAYGSYAELLADDRIEAVYNALPNAMHHPWTMAALAAGKHVLCEKPLAVTADQARQMFDEARRRDRVLVEAFMYRAHPLTHKAIELLRGGAIGDLRLIRTSFCYCTNKIDGNVRFSTDLAGGALMDIGCYCTSLCLLAAGEPPTQVQAAAHLHPTGVDDLTVGTMSFACGVVASFTCGMRAQTDNTAYLCGTEGFIEIPIPWKPPTRDATLTLRTMAGPRMDGKPGGPTEQTYTVDAPGPLYGMEADAFAATVLDGAEPFMSEADSLANAELLDQMRRQIGLGY